MALPHKQISHISVKRMHSAASVPSVVLEPAMSLSNCDISSLYFAASSRTAGREERKVDIFWRANTS